MSSDALAIDSAIASLSPRSGTRIDRGMRAALAALGAARPNAGQVIVLLSDGKQVEDPETARAAGDDARAAGVLVYTIGLGTGADAALLGAVASEPGNYAFVPNPSDLAGVYSRIAASIPGCP